MASQRGQVYRCEVCNNVVEVVRAGAGRLTCCGVPMFRLEENTIDAAREKHVPQIEKVDGGISVRVGSVPHLMQPEHYIEWIEVSLDGKTYRQHLNPGEKPETFFPVQGEQITVREICNLHGLWKAA